MKDANVKMADMTRDPDQLGVMVSNYDPKYPIGFFLDPKMVEELGLKGKAKSGESFKIVGSIKISSVTESEEGDKVEAYVHLTELGVVGTDDAKSPSQMMAEQYGDDDGKKQS